MKLNRILTGEIDLTETRNLQLVRTLPKGTRVKFFGKDCSVFQPLHRDPTGKWRIVVESIKSGEKFGYYVTEVKKLNKMTDKEKRVWKENIAGNLKNYQNDPNKLVMLCKTYHQNLVEFNNYRLKDVQEVLETFGDTILGEAKISFQ